MQWSFPRPRRRVRVLLLVGLALAVGTFLLRLPWVGERACGLARAQLPRVLGGPLEIGRCELDPLGVGVVLEDVAMRQEGVERPIFEADRLEVSFGGYDPLVGSLQLGHVQAVRPRVALDLSHPPQQPPLTEPPAECPLRVLERLGADRIEIQNATLRIQLPGARRIEVTGLELDWRTRRNAVEFRTLARGGVVDLGDGGGSFALSKLDVSGKLSPLKGLLEVTSAELGLEGFNATLSGQLEDLCNPALRVDAQLLVPLRAVAKATGIQEEMRGQLLARVFIDGKPESPAVRLEVAGTDVVVGIPGGGVRDIGSFRLRAAVSGKQALLQELVVPTGTGTVRISGQGQLSPPFPVTLRVDADRAEFASAMEKAGLPGAWVNFLTSGKANLKGTLAPFHVRGDIDMKGQRFMLAGQSWRAPPRPELEILSFPEGHILTGIEFWPDRVDFTKARIATPSGASVAQGDVTIWFDPAKGLRIQGSMPTVDLSEFKRLAGFDMSGRGTVGFSIGGPMADIGIHATLSLHDLYFWDYALGVAQGPLDFTRGVLAFPSVVGQKGRTQYFGSLELDFNKPDLYVKAHAHVPAGRAEDLVEIIAPLSETVEVFQDALFGTAVGAIDIESPASKLTGTMNVDLDQLEYYGRHVGKGELRFRFIDGDRLTLDRANFRGPLGTLTARGDYGFDDTLRFRFRAEPLELGELAGPQRAKSLGIHGNITLGGRVEGTTDIPLVSASIFSPRVSFAERDLGELQLEATLTGRDLRLWGSPFRDAQAELKLKLKEPYAYVADLVLSLPEIRPVLPAGAIAQGVSGQLSARLHASGEMKGNAPPEARADIDRLSLSRGDFSVESDGPLHLRYTGGRLEAEPFRLVGPNTELSASGTLARNNLDARVRGALDMRLLESLSSTFERTAGRVELNAALHGNVAAPLLVGNARIEGVGLSVRNQDLHLRDLTGQVSFSDARILLDGLEGVLNEGRITLSGEAVLDRFSLRKVGVRASLDGVNLRPTPDLPLTASGDLLVTGAPSSLLKLSGELTVDHLRYEQPIVLESFLQRLLAPSIGRSGQASREWLGLDVGVKLVDARIDNNLARGRIFGSFRVTGTNLRPGLLGTVEAGAGGLAYFRGNRFDITQGMMEFQDRSEVDAVFDLHAQSQVREYLVRLHAFGRMSSPRVVLTAEPPLAEGDVLSLLTLGITSRDRQNTAGTSAGLAAEALMSVTGLDRQVERFLPKNALLRDLSLRVATLYNGATGLVEPTPQLESKLLTEQLKIRIAQPVSGRGTRAQAEYNFTDRVSAQAQWDNENVDYSFGNLGLDLKLRWDVE